MSLPTETPVPPTREPASGACALLTQADVEELVGTPATRLSATGQSCGYAHGEMTVVLTLQPAHAFTTNHEAFAETDDPRPVDGLSAPAFYFDETLDGALLIEAEQTLILSGVPTLDLARQLAERILAHQQ